MTDTTSDRRPAPARLCLLFLALTLLAGLIAAPGAAAAPSELWTKCDKADSAIQCNFPRGIAANPANGHIYVADQNNQRIDEFNASGEFIRAWGWGVDTGAAEFQICTAASGCQAGLAGDGSGQFNLPMGVAVDSAGDVYVTDFNNHRVEKFGPLGNFLLSFGESGTGPGQFGAWGIGNAITVGPSDSVYVGDKERIERFDTAGAFQSECSVPAGMAVQSLASDSAGNLYAVYETSPFEYQPGVRKLTYAPGGECGETGRFDIPDPDAFTHPHPSAVAVDAAGDVYAFSDKELGNGFVPLDRIYEFNPTGEVIAQFGKGGFTGSRPSSTGMAANLCAGSEAPGDLYVSNTTNGTGPPKSNEAFIRAYGTEPVGCFKARTLAATNVTEHAATLNGTVNPSGTAVSECRFEYGTSVNYGSQAACVPASLGEGSEPVPVHADLSLLEKGTVYHFRLVAKVGAEVETGSDEEFKTTGPPTISGERASGVTDSEARLTGTVNPEGFATSYRFDYGPTSEYGQSTASIAIGAGRAAHAVSATISGLAPGSTYHWRLVAENSSGPTDGEDRELTTYRAFSAEGGCPNQALRSGASAFLPDCRAYEMVSPVDKNGGDIIMPGEEGGNVRATADGGKLTYTSIGSFGDEANGSYNNQYIASRGPDGWTNHGIHPPVHGEGTGVFGLVREFMAFTPDLCSAWLVDSQRPPITEDGQPHYENLYRRENCEPGDGDLEAVVPFPPALPEGGGEYLGLGARNTAVVGVSEDGSRAFFNAGMALPQVAEASTAIESGEPIVQTYERSETGLKLVSVLPNGTANPTASTVGSGWNGDLHNAVSPDGSRVYWTAGGASGTIYLRRHPEQGIVAGECSGEAACTVKVSGVAAHFWGASADGRRAIYTETNQLTNKVGLFEFEEGAAKTKLANDPLGVVAASEDLSHVYFVSRDKLGQKNEQEEEASEGDPNLYLWSEGTISFIGTLSEGDVGQRAPEAELLAYSLASSFPRERAARASADGTRLAFESRAALIAGKDNTAPDGKAAVEVYLYDATAGPAGRLSCVSCNPSGESPETGELAPPYEAKINPALTRVQAAAWIPAWEQSLYATNVLSAGGGRLFFNSNDALLPRDTNGAQDVYEWEQAGLGSCREDSPSFFPQNGGCLYLVSSGESPTYSEFWEASPDGSDVFFGTESSLLPQDPGLIDLYDARVGGGFAQPSQTAACEGEACQSPPPPPAETTPASAAFQGPGNVSGAKKKKKKKHEHKRKHKKQRHHARHRADHKGRAAR